MYILVKDKILPRRFPRAVSCGRLALRGAATLPSRGPKANLLKPPPENGINISVILITDFFYYRCFKDIIVVLPCCLVMSLGTEPRLEVGSTLVVMDGTAMSSNLDRRPTGADPRRLVHD